MTEALKILKREQLINQLIQAIPENLYRWPATKNAVQTQIRLHQDQIMSFLRENKDLIQELLKNL